ncbi:hypothetical protein J2S43_003824 [Catenuloplanes nepalensis]|uniref:Uncharacterized protein n=1 Tax=Catenuloplanes nepalensis TaxID=587533 RepID=A0ABT9MV44_9ACTN|nr:hypothetical protein [Catenuloplanes nepalensis]MDP9795312.1 hypothetical protein [Catenuloplanes nepalensis]
MAALLGAGRPYAAALALAERPELTSAEILTLTGRPGASRRMIRGLHARLASRADADQRPA